MTQRGGFRTCHLSKWNFSKRRTRPKPDSSIIRRGRLSRLMFRLYSNVLKRDAISSCYIHLSWSMILILKMTTSINTHHMFDLNMIEFVLLLPHYLLVVKQLYQSSLSFCCLCEKKNEKVK